MVFHVRNDLPSKFSFFVFMTFLRLVPSSTQVCPTSSLPVTHCLATSLPYYKKCNDRLSIYDFPVPMITTRLRPNLMMFAFIMSVLI
jgi:hypothetical protein